MSLYLAPQWKPNIQIWRFLPFFLGSDDWKPSTYLPGLLSSSSPLFLFSTFLLNFPAFELLCLFSCVSFFLWNNKQAKKFGAWRWLGCFLHSSLHTLQVCGFSYSNSWNVVCFFCVASFWIWSVELWVLVFFHFGFGPLVHTCIRSEQIWAM